MEQTIPNSSNKSTGYELKIICAGIGRTGTVSLKHALEKLGFPAYHGFDILEKKTHQNFWYNAVTNTDANINFEEIYGNKYVVSIAGPQCYFYKQLCKENPNAKVILTVIARKIGIIASMKLSMKYMILRGGTSQLGLYII